MLELNLNVDFKIEYIEQEGIKFLKTEIIYLPLILDKIKSTEIDFDLWTQIIKTVISFRGFILEKWDRKKIKLFNIPQLVKKIITSDYFIEELLILTNAVYKKNVMKFPWVKFDDFEKVIPKGFEIINDTKAFFKEQDGMIIVPLYFLGLLNIIDNIEQFNNIEQFDTIELMQNVRNDLLKNNNYKLYKELVDFIQEQSETVEDSIYDCLEPKNYNKKYIVYFVTCIKRKLQKFKVLRYKEYNEKIINGQLQVWEPLGKCYIELSNIRTKINHLDVLVYEESYGKSSESMTEIIGLLSRAYSILTDFERKMGLDRYLSYSIAKNDFQLLMELFKEIKYLTEDKSKELKEKFQINWNSSLIGDSVLGMFNLGTTNILNRYIPNNQDTVFMFIIDGYGACQHKWNKACFESKDSFAYGIHLFNWLSNKKYYNDKMYLGTSLISDTGAGISTIFTGQLPKETGLIASKVIRNNRFINIKSCDENDFDNICNPNSQSFLNKLVEKNIYTQVFYGSYFSRGPYSSLCYGNSIVSEERIAERIFNRVSSAIKDDERQLIISYYPKLDNTGHPTGAFTTFELFEHEKLNFLFTNFLINLLKEKPCMFNGKNSVIITADHGMAETLQKTIRVDDFNSLIPNYIKSKSKIVQNNRALLIYDVEDSKIDELVGIIRNLFEIKELDFEIFTKRSKLVKETICGEEGTVSHRNCPDIIVSLKGEGIFFNVDLPPGSYHFGAHGGSSLEETIVPYIIINLTEELKDDLKQRFLKLG